MFGLTPYNKNRGMARTDDVVDFYNMVDNFFNDTESPLRSLATDNFKVDVKEKDDEYLVDAEFAGYDKEDIHVKFDEGNLLISASKKEEKNDENERYIHRERSFRSMERQIYLPNVADGDIKAKFENGVLEIHVPKAKELEMEKQIQIE